MTAAILATSVALPEFAYSQEEVRGFIGAWLSHDPDKAAKADAILRNSEIARRHTARPAEWYLSHTSVSERSRAYAEEMVRLSEAASRQALERAGIPAEGIGLIVTTSCTGIIIPPVESHLMNRMPFRPTTRRMPLTELGCVAGATAMSHAHQYLRANPFEAVLVISAELASLTAQVEDFSLTNIVAAAIFGDGAAAAVLVGGEHPRLGEPRPGDEVTGDGASVVPPHPRIVATRGVQFPGTLDLMGFHNTDTGLQIFLSPRVPRFIRDELPRHLPPFLEEQGVTLRDLKHFLLHPGGRKVLEGLQRELHLTREQTRLSWDVLRDYGNLSSATVLFLLNRFEREVQPERGDYGLMVAVGPGFASEMLLLQW